MFARGSRTRSIPSFSSQLCARCQLIARRSASTKLSQNELNTATPVAEQLAATGLWNYGRWKKAAAAPKGAKGKRVPKLKGDKTRVNVVDEKLCDDIISYMKPSLGRHAGCDLIDIYPGAGLWSSKLHEALRPRSHILMEPDEDVYRPFLSPLLEKPGVQLVPKSGIIWHELNEVLNPAYLPHQTEAKTAPGEMPQRNDTLLVTANLASHPKKKFRTFDSIALLVLFQFLSSIRAGSLFQKYGLVRMLVWTGPDDKNSLLPRVIQRRRRMAVDAELSCEWLTEVAGPDTLDQTGGGGWFARDWSIDVGSSRLALGRMEEAGVEMPEGRKTKLVRAVEALDKKGRTKQRKKKAAAAAAEVAPTAAGEAAPLLVKPFIAELAELEADFEKGKFSEQDAEYQRLKLLRAKDGRMKLNAGIMLDVIREQREIEGLAESAAPDDAEAQRAVAERAADWSGRIQKLSRMLRGDVVLARDNLHLFNQEPPVLLWDRRRLEPLVVGPDEFFPNVPCSLLDIQPKAMHALLRDMGPRSGRGGDTFELLLRALFASTVEPVSTAIEVAWPGAAEGTVPRCPSLRDRARGGSLIGGYGEMTSRTLNEAQLIELLQAWMTWPFRPTYSELVGRVADDNVDDVAEEGGVNPFEP